MKKSYRWVSFVFLAWLGVRLVLAFEPAVPRQLDELGYLASARFLATGEGALDPAGRAPYKLGYPLLLTPAFWAADDVEEAFLYVRLLNAVLMASMLPLAAALAGRLESRLEDCDRVLIGAVVATAPAAVLYGTTAMAENVLLPGFLLYLLVAWRAWAEGGARWWVSWGLVAGLLYLVHERAIGWLLIAVAACLLAAFRRRRPAPLGLLPAAAAIGWLPLEVPGSRWQTGASALDYLAHLGAFPKTLFATLIGQTWYLGLATFGLLFAGLVLVARRRDTWRSPDLALLFLAAASMSALSLVLMGQREQARLTHWLYGRYNESVLPALAVVVAVALWRARRRQLVAAAVVAAGLLAAGALVLRLLWSPEIGRPYSFNVPAVAAYEAVAGWGLPRAGGLAVAALTLLTAAFARRWRLGMAVWLVLSVASSLVTWRDDDWSARGQWRQRERHLAELLREMRDQDLIAAPAVVCYDRRSFPSFHYYHYDFYLPDLQLRVADLPAAGERARDLCAGDLWITAGLEATAGLAAARVVALETLPPDNPPYSQTLAVLPGDLLDSLEARGWLLPSGFPGPLSRAGLRGSISLEDRVVAVGAGPAVEIHHRGTAPWPHALGLRRFEYRVAVVARWHDAGGAEVSASASELPRMLLPGDRWRLPLPAPLGGGMPLPPGRYRLRVEVDQYLTRDWAGAGGAVLEETVEIRR